MGISTDDEGVMQTPPPAADAGESVQDQLARAFEYHQKGLAAEAAAAYQAVLAVDPNNANAFHLLGALANQLGQPERAIQLFRQAIAIDPQVTIFHFNLGTVLVSLRDFAGAADAYKLAVGLSPEPDLMFHWARAAQQAGQLNVAASAYQRLLQLQPDRPEAYRELGIVQHRQAQLDDAIMNLRMAVMLTPDDAMAHNELGQVYVERGDVDAALVSTKQAVACNPDFAEAHFNLGQLLLSCGDVAAAEASFRQAIVLQPGAASAHNGVGLVLLQQRRFVEAEDSFRQGLALLPTSSEIATNLGHALRAQGRLQESIGVYQDALRMNPRRAEALNGLGAALGDVGDVQGAISALETALTLNPLDLDVRVNLGIIHYDLGNFSQAAECYRQVLSLKPQHAAAHSYLANVFQEQGELAAAEASRLQAIALDPEQAEAHFGLAFTLLHRGDWTRGFAEYEWRWRCHRFAPSGHPFSAPVWDGRPLNGETILIFAEQGLGDTIQFVRFSRVQERGGNVVLYCQPELRRLLTTIEGADSIVSATDVPPPFDFQLPLLSLPHVLGLTPDTLPAAAPYLQAEPELAADWAVRLPESIGYRVGLAWAGNPKHKMNARRSIPLAQLAPIGGIANASFYSLQKDGAEAFNPPSELRLSNLSTLLEDFADTAAALANLDLVITVDDVRCAPGRRAGPAGLAVVAARSGLALDDGRLNQSLVPDSTPVPPRAPGRLGHCRAGSVHRTARGGGLAVQPKTPSRPTDPRQSTIVARWVTHGRTHRSARRRFPSALLVLLR